MEGFAEESSPSKAALDSHRDQKVLGYERLCFNTVIVETATSTRKSKAGGTEREVRRSERELRGTARRRRPE